MVPKIIHTDLAPHAREFRIEGMPILQVKEMVNIYLPLRNKGWNKIWQMGEPGQNIIPAISRVYGLRPMISVEHERMVVFLDRRCVDLEIEAEEVYAEIHELMELTFQGEEAWQAYWERKCREVYEAGLGCGKCVRGWIDFCIAPRGSGRSNSGMCPTPGCHRDDLYWEKWRDQRREKGLPVLNPWDQWSP